MERDILLIIGFFILLIASFLTGIRIGYRAGFIRGLNHQREYQPRSKSKFQDRLQQLMREADEKAKTK